MKRLFDWQIQQLEYFQFVIRKQILELQGAKATIQTVVALEIGRATVQQVQESTNIDEVTASLGQFQDSSPTPSGAATGSDEDELRQSSKKGKELTLFLRGQSEMVL